MTIIIQHLCNFVTLRNYTNPIIIIIYHSQYKSSNTVLNVKTGLQLPHMHHCDLLSHINLVSQICQAITRPISNLMKIGQICMPVHAERIHENQ